MGARPHPLIESLVRLLVPPASREHVMGDLSERYRSPSLYLLEVLRTLPFVLASRVRRTTNVPWLVVVAFVFGFGVFYGPFQSSWIVATIPTLVCAAVLVLRNAYRVPTQTSVAPTRFGEALIDVAAVAACVLLSQLAVAHFAPDLLLSRWPALRVGLPVGAALLFLIRLQAPVVAAWPPPISRVMSRAELASEASGFESARLRAIRIEIGVSLAVIAWFGLVFWAAPTAIGKAASFLTIGGVLFVVWFLRRHARAAPVADGLTFTELATHYRGNLERQAARARTALWWYVLPLAGGPVLLTVAISLGAPVRSIIAIKLLAGFLLIGVLIVLLNRRAVRQLEKRIAQLETVSERT